MRFTVKLPRVAETVNEVVVLEWKVGLGEPLVVGQTLMTVETDKAIVDVPTPVGGMVSELLVLVGEEISTGHAIIVVEGD